MTFRMLLTHTASFPAYDTPTTIGIFYGDLIRKLNLTKENYPSYPEWIEEYVSPTGSYYSSENWAKRRPGTQYAYSNVGFCILRYLLEHLSNQTCEQYMSKHIFQPLNMTNTKFNLTEFNNDSLARLYGWHPDEQINVQYHHYSNEFYIGAGGLYTTVIDLAKFLIAHMNGGSYNGFQLLNESTIGLMHSKQVINPEMTEYFGHESYDGLGWNMINSTGEVLLQGHTGRTVGSTTMMFYFEEMMISEDGIQITPKNIGVILFANQGNVIMQSAKEILYSDSESTINDILVLIASTASGKKTSETQSISQSFTPVILALSLLTTKLILQRKSRL
ncbi:MAG: serine hydrolase domain-containing protein [Candidatus Hodarchaeales archaeon]